MVTYHLTVRDRAINDGISIAMSKDHFVSAVELSIPFGLEGALPKPAPARQLDFSTEPLFRAAKITFSAFVSAFVRAKPLRFAALSWLKASFASFTRLKLCVVSHSRIVSA
jgi:hypothetical protein